MNDLAEYVAQRALAGGTQATAHDKLCFVVLVHLLGCAQDLGDTWVFFDKDAKFLRQAVQMLVGDIETDDLFFAVLTGNDVGALVSDFLQNFCNEALIQGIAREQVQQKEQKLRQLLRFVYWYGKNGSKSVYQALMNNPFVMHQDQNGTRPLVLSQNTSKGFGVWLHRMFVAELAIVRHLEALDNHHHLDISDFAEVFEDNTLNKEQVQAVKGALSRRFCVITGGPGTGKTFCVAKIVQAFLGDPNFRLALTAPTGKAALRMQESLKNALGDVPLPEAMTLHRLLGMGRTPIYDQNNPLPYDMIVVDEASMLGVQLAAMLCRAVGKNTRMVWLGDSHQLSAVEAGAVLFELCRHPSFTDCHYRLSVSRRFDGYSAIGRLAHLVNQGATGDNILAAIASDDSLSLQNPQDFNALFGGFLPFFESCQSIKRQTVNATVLKQLFDALRRFCVLTDTHEGRAGDIAINAWLSERYCRYYKEPMGEWFFGRVVMVCENRYDLGLYNGDIGICLFYEGRVLVYFEDKAAGIMPVVLKNSVTTAYAMTVHKSQGSEFDEVAVFMQKIVGRELLYTAITRAKKQVRLFMDPDVVVKAAQEPTQRSSGMQLIKAGN